MRTVTLLRREAARSGPALRTVSAGRGADRRMEAAKAEEIKTR